MSHFFALKPLYGRLVTRPSVPVRFLNPSGQLASEISLRSFQDIEVEIWAGHFLADMDRFLTMARLPVFASDSALQACLASVQKAKTQLSASIPTSLAPVFQSASVPAESSTPPTEYDALAPIQTLLAQQLGLALAPAYNTSVIARCEGQDTTPWIVSCDQLGATVPAATNAPAFTAAPWVVTASRMFFKTPAPELILFATVLPPVSPTPLTPVQILTGSPFPSVLHPATPAELPVPLRTCPPSPTLIAQAALPFQAAETATVTLTDAARWTYRFNYIQPTALQDEVLITVSFNSAPEAIASADGSPPPADDDLFDALAQYNSIAGALWSNLTVPNGTLTPGAVPELFRNTAGAFAMLAENTARVWTTRSVQPTVITDSSHADEAATFSFLARVIYRTDSEGNIRVDALVLTRQQEQPGPAKQWPLVLTANGVALAFESESETSETRVYRLPPEAGLAAMTTPPNFTLSWADLNIAAVQNARGQLKIRRNAYLNQTAGVVTNPDFIFESATVAPAVNVTPLVTWARDFTIEGTTIADALTTAFAALFETTDDLLLGFEIRYRYPLIPEQDQTATGAVLPVMLSPPRLLDASLPEAIAQAAEQWREQIQPVTTGAEWLFSFSLHSTATLHNTPTPPLMELSQLVLPVVPVAPAVSEA
ncbi:MAG: hypothetical protein JF599_01070 [Verrucomicrobia bacterium]|nr:hypothetical protein [Verrucomicrobiota bacterium]